MHLSPLDWQSLTVEYPFSAQQQAVGFFDFQTNAAQALKQFILDDHGNLLLLKADTLPDIFFEVERFLKQHTLAVNVKTDFTEKTLFGYSVYLEQENKLETVEGFLQKADNGILILNLNKLLTDISQWDKLKQALLFGEYEQIQLNPIPKALPAISVQFKLILVGSREDMAILANYDENLPEISQYAELNRYLKLNNENYLKWGYYINSLCNDLGYPPFSPQVLNQLLKYFVRDSEDKQLITILPTILKKQIKHIHAFYQNKQNIMDISAYLAFWEAQSAIINDYTIRDILSNQIYIETQGAIIGQINGLSVVEFDGVPYAFGEPLRITCNVQYGEGEIHDIERKVELGGNIHSKGILIAQSCLANLLELPAQLPFSASLAFEQSYGEIDGDSSSLAIFCVLISALSKRPLPQSLAVTGAIDQFGNVLSVGGVNQKIEGFFRICQERGLTGEQGVIIPAVCVSQLCLKSEVIEAVKAGQFNIWTVSDVFEAVWLLFEHYFYEEDAPQQTDKAAIFTLIHQYIEQGESTVASGSLWQKIGKRLKLY
ncbi:protease [[Actinobacillus] muris]|uniref:endopeptidase La n=1 Tax=Muribacter muris TaxID=67855 RepID=A0A0J5P602_9PAST|nr:AAA family ATPase [Muribacter muris]KMK51200.1 protease [[Actinobacillus] muris] [Muribacter muris]